MLNRYSYVAVVSVLLILMLAASCGSSGYRDTGASPWPLSYLCVKEVEVPEAFGAGSPLEFKVVIVVPVANSHNVVTNTRAFASHYGESQEETTIVVAFPLRYSFDLASEGETVEMELEFPDSFAPYLDLSAVESLAPGDYRLVVGGSSSPYRTYDLDVQIERTFVVLAVEEGGAGE